MRQVDRDQGMALEVHIPDKRVRLVEANILEVVIMSRALGGSYRVAAAVGSHVLVLQLIDDDLLDVEGCAVDIVDEGQRRVHLTSGLVSATLLLRDLDPFVFDRLETKNIDF